MNKTQAKQNKRERRHARIRAKVSGTAQRPRLAIFKSNRFIYAQLIDDDKSVTLAAVKSVLGKPGREAAIAAGTQMAKLAKEKGVTKTVFDRGGFSYIGTIKEFAEAARAGGLEF
jgi:large subunit ribosomal protein L18